MSVVIDANAANALAAANCDSSCAIIKWVRSGGMVESGGRLQEELRKTALRDLLAQWSAAGRLFVHPQKVVEATEKEVAKQCKSDDPHVVAILKIGGAQILISGDAALHSDARNARLVGKKCKIVNFNQGSFSNVKIVRGLLGKFG